MTIGNDFINYVSSEAVSGDNLGLTKREFFAAMALQGLRASKVIKEKSSPLEANSL